MIPPDFKINMDNNLYQKPFDLPKPPLEAFE